MIKNQVQDIPHFVPQLSQAQTQHRIALYLLTIISFLTRFSGLSHPSVVIFDEIHVLRFTSNYLSGEYFFDVHPPFGRLFYVLLARLLGCKEIIIPDNVGSSYLNGSIPYVALRAPQALLSALTVPVVYQILWECGCGPPACILAAGLLTFDTAHIAHTRLIYMDGLLCFMIASSLLCYIKFTKQPSWSVRWFAWLTLTGLCLSCIVSTKYIGVFTYLTIGTYTIIELWRLYLGLDGNQTMNLWTISKHVLWRVVTLLLIPFALYLTWFWVHLKLLPNSGSGDGFMSETFQSTLEDNMFNMIYGHQDLSFFDKWLELQALIFKENQLVGNGEVHRYESRPMSWLRPNHGVSFWCSNKGRQQIFFMGNVPGWWIGTISILVFLLILLLHVLGNYNKLRSLCSSQVQHLRMVSSFFFVAWLTHYLPFFLMSRQLMLHSYLPASIAASMLAGSLLELLDIGRWEHIQENHQKTREKTKESNEMQGHTRLRDGNSSMLTWCICFGSLLSVSLFWWYWIPLTYGQPGLSYADIQQRELYTGTELRLSQRPNSGTCYD